MQRMEGFGGGNSFDERNNETRNGRGMKIANKEMRGALRRVEDEYERAKRIIRDGNFLSSNRVVVLYRIR